jgi:uncharacterized membrane protein
MNLTRPLILAGAFTAASVGIGVWAYLQLPAHVTFGMNYGLDGRPHSFLPKAEGLAIMPGVALLVVSILAVAPMRSRAKSGLMASADAYGLLLSSLAALFLVAQAALIAHAFDPAFDVLRWVFLAGAVLIALVGNTLGKVRPNDIFGLRTRWTLADPRVWDKTHRFTGRGMVASGLIFAAIAFLVPDHRLLIAAFVLCVITPIFAGVFYSSRISAQPQPG